MYKFRPILKTLVWGTENWVLSGVPGSESVVAEGPAELIDEIDAQGFERYESDTESDPASPSASE